MIKLIPPKITPYYLNEDRKLCDIVSHNKILGDLNLHTDRYADISERYVTELRDNKKKILGYEIFSFEDFYKNVFGYSIRVSPELRQKGFNLGELLRLSSIVEMFENNMQKIKIYSKDTAIYFHSKYKFQPTIETFKDRDEALKSMAENPDNGIMTALSAKAKSLLEKLQKTQSPEEQRDAIAKTNEIAKQYIEKALNSKEGYKAYPFEYGMGMELRKESVIENRDFYNELFAKHGIDYQI